MKIIHCIGHLSGGGAETQMRLFINNCSPNIDNVIISFDSTKTDIDEEHCKIYDLASIPLYRKWVAIYRVFKNEKPDIIHLWIPAIFFYFIPPALYYTKAKKALGIRSVYKLNGIKRGLHYCLYYMGNNYISNVHPADIKGVFSVFAKRRFYYVPNGLILSKKSDCTSDNDRLLFVGRFIEDKDVPLLIKALIKLRKDGVTFRLDLCGKGPTEEKIKQLVSDNNLTSVHFHGFRSDLSKYYVSASALVLPSLREGMPNVAFEAAAYNNILILSDIPQHKRWFRDNYNAILFRSKDLDSLYDALIRFYNMNAGDRQRLIENNQKLLQELSVEKYCQKLISVYEQIKG